MTSGKNATAPSASDTLTNFMTNFRTAHAAGWRYVIASASHDVRDHQRCRPAGECIGPARLPKASRPRGSATSSCCMHCDAQQRGHDDRPYLQRKGVPELIGMALRIDGGVVRSIAWPNRPR